MKADIVSAKRNYMLIDAVCKLRSPWDEIYCCAGYILLNRLKGFNNKLYADASFFLSTLDYYCRSTEDENLASHDCVNR